MFLKIGDHLILEQNVPESNNSDVRRCRCKIADLRKNEIWIDDPADVQTGRTVVIPKEAVMNAYYVRDRQVFQFTTRMLHRVPGKISLLALRYDEDIGLEQVQRRNYVRVETNLDIAVHPENKACPPFTALTSDIGGGGVQIFLPGEITVEENATVELWICLVFPSGVYRYVTLKGKILRLFTDKVTQRRKASIQFLAADERERQTIIRYCFEKQLESRRKFLEWEMDHRY